MRIGELAKQAGVDVQTIRFYEREALIEAPLRTASGYRNYAPAHLERLNFIRHCRYQASAGLVARSRRFLR